MISGPMFVFSELMAMASGTTHLSEVSSMSSSVTDFSTRALAANHSRKIANVKSNLPSCSITMRELAIRACSVDLGATCAFSTLSPDLVDATASSFRNSSVSPRSSSESSSTLRIISLTIWLGVLPHTDIGCLR